MPSLTLKVNLGAILIGTLVNLFFYTLEITQVVAYFTSARRKTDKLWIKLCVAFNMLADTIASFASWAGIFIYSVVNWGRVEDLHNHIWPLVVVILVGGLVTFVVQSFMAYRYWKMSSNHIIAALILVCMLVTLGGTLRTGISTALEPSLSERRDHLRISIISFAGNCITDLSLTIALLYQLHQGVHSFTRNTQDLLWRVTFLVVTTGCVPSVFTTMGVVLLAVQPKTYLATAVAFMYGRVYSLTMLYTLNLRDKIRGESWVHTVDVVSSRLETNKFHDEGRGRGGSDASTAAFARKRTNSQSQAGTATTEDTAEFLTTETFSPSASAPSFSGISGYDVASSLEEGGLRSPVSARPPSKKVAVVHRVLLPNLNLRSQKEGVSCPSLMDVRHEGRGGGGSTESEGTSSMRGNSGKMKRTVVKSRTL